jgi:hypothetical protein
MGTFAQWVKLQEDRQQDGIGYFARYWAQVTPGKISSVDGIKRHLDRLGKQAAESGDERAIAAFQAAESGYRLAVKEYHQVQAQANAEANGLTVSKPEPPPFSHETDLSRPPDVRELMDPVIREQHSNDPYPERAAGQHVPEPPPGERPVRVVGAAAPLAGAAADAARRQQELYEAEWGPLVAGPLHGPAGKVQGAETAAKAGKYTGWPESRFDRIEHRLGELHELYGQIAVRLETLLDLMFPEPHDWDELWRASASYRDGLTAGDPE